MRPNHKTFGAILLVSGTAIGAGMLALPLNTATSGFFPACITFILGWFVMTLTGLLIMEVNLWFKGNAEVDLISMTRQTLGPLGMGVAWVSYLLLLYALISAYLTACSAWLGILFEHFSMAMPQTVYLLILSALVGSIVCHGTELTEKVNRYFALGLLLAYCILIALASYHIQPALLHYNQFKFIPYTLPLTITAFGFATVIPSLTHYLNRSISSLKKTIIIGSALPLAVYLLWELVTLGIIPLEGTRGLIALSAQHDNGTGIITALEHITGSHWVTHSARIFAICAIITSFLGVALSLFHFLADGLKLNPKKGARLPLLALTFLPPIALVLFYPQGFGRILSFAGIFAAILFGIIPSFMAWRGRYHAMHPLSTPTHFRVFGGKPLLILILLFFSAIIYWEIQNCIPCQ